MKLTDWRGYSEDLQDTHLDPCFGAEGTCNIIDEPHKLNTIYQTFWTKRIITPSSHSFMLWQTDITESCDIYLRRQASVADVSCYICLRKKNGGGPVIHSQHKMLLGKANSCMFVRAVASTTRVRRKHSWQNQKSISLKSSKDQKDGVCSGSQTELEYLVVSEIISCCNHYVRKVFQQITIEGKAFEME